MYSVNTQLEVRAVVFFIYNIFSSLYLLKLVIIIILKVLKI